MLKVQKINLERAFIVDIFEKQPVIWKDYKGNELKNLTLEAFKKIQELRQLFGEDTYLLDTHLINLTGGKYE